jgi:hypothetical protein
MWPKCADTLREDQRTRVGLGRVCALSRRGSSSQVTPKLRCMSDLRTSEWCFAEGRLLTPERLQGYPSQEGPRSHQGRTLKPLIDELATEMDKMSRQSQRRNVYVIYSRPTVWTPAYCPIIHHGRYLPLTGPTIRRNLGSDRVNKHMGLL